MATNPMGAALPLGQPGAKSGYFQILRPPISLYYVPGYVLHPNVVAAAAAGTFTVKFGTLLVIEKASGQLKVAVKTATANNWEVVCATTASPAALPLLTVGPILPSLNTLLDPSVVGSSTIAVPFTSWFDAQTDRVDASYAAPAVNDLVTPGPNGDFVKATANTDPAVAIVKSVQTAISGVPGGTQVTVLTLSYKGTALTPWFAV